MAIQINNMNSEEIEKLFKTKPVWFSAHSSRGAKIEKVSSTGYEYTTKAGKMTMTYTPWMKIVGSNSKWFI